MDKAVAYAGRERAARVRGEVRVSFLREPRGAAQAAVPSAPSGGVQSSHPVSPPPRRGGSVCKIPALLVGTYWPLVAFI